MHHPAYLYGCFPPTRPLPGFLLVIASYSSLIHLPHPTSSYNYGTRSLILLQDSVTGLLLAGIGHVDQQQQKNFLIVDPSMFAPHSIASFPPPSHTYLFHRTSGHMDERITDLGRVETQTTVIESTFQEFTERKDIAILLINQHVRLPNFIDGLDR